MNGTEFQLWISGTKEKHKQTNMHSCYVPFHRLHLQIVTDQIDRCHIMFAKIVRLSYVLHLPMKKRCEESGVRRELDGPNGLDGWTSICWQKTILWLLWPQYQQPNVVCWRARPNCLHKRRSMIMSRNPIRLLTKCRKELCVQNKRRFIRSNFRYAIYTSTAIKRSDRMFSTPPNRTEHHTLLTL